MSEKFENKVNLSNEKYQKILHELSLLKVGKKKKKYHVITGCFRGIYLFIFFFYTFF